MPFDEESRQRTRGFWLRELSGLALLFWAVFLFMCLTSFSLADPSLNHALSSGEVQNLGGVIGAYMAGLLNDFFGAGSLILPGGLGIMGLGFLSSRFSLTWSRWLGFALASVCLMIFFAALDLSLGDLNSGGMLGILVYRASRSLLSPFGAGLLWFFVFLVGIQLFMDLPWRKVFTLLSGLFSRRDEEDADFILEDDAAPRATRLGQGASTPASSKWSALAGRLGKGLVGTLGNTLGGRFSRKCDPEPHGLNDTTRLDLNGADEATGEAAAPASTSGDPCAKPAKVRTAPIVQLKENDIPFASLEDCGVPVDTLYAEQYSSDVKGEAPVVVRKIRKPRTRGKNGQKNALLRLLLPAGKKEEAYDADDLRPHSPDGEPSRAPGTGDEASVDEAAFNEGSLNEASFNETSFNEPSFNETSANEGVFNERAALFGNDPDDGFSGNGFTDDDLFHLEEHGGTSSTISTRGASAARPDFSLALDDFDKVSRIGKGRKTKSAAQSVRTTHHNPGDVAVDHDDSHSADGLDHTNNTNDRDTLYNTRKPNSGHNGAVSKDDFGDKAYGFDDLDNLDNHDNGSFVGLNGERPDFGPVSDPLERTTGREDAALSRGSARASFAGSPVDHQPGPIAANDLFEAEELEEYGDEDDDGDRYEDENETGYGVDTRKPDIVRGTGGLGKGKQERVSATDGLMFPPIELLDKPVAEEEVQDEELEDYAERLMCCLNDFGIQAELVRATPGPVVTTYMLRPAPGVSVRSFLRHTEDIARSLMAVSVFIQAPVPGTDTVGIVIPNRTRQVVNFRQIAEDKAFVESKAHLPLIIGKDTTGLPFVADLAKMPHLLVAGATGQGKSVCLNAMLTSLLVRKTPNELKLLLVDPKRVEMGIYEHESHLIHPVVKEVEDAKNALIWAVQEMDQRYTQMSRLNTKNIEGYNAKLASYNGKLPQDIADLAPMPYIVIVIDELADLMLQARKDVEPCIIRLAQLARASGIHMIIATQRPSVDVVTGLIKANFPCRICFRVSARQDSMTTLGQAGAEKLLGNGDMFYNPNGGQLVRLHGPYLRDEEVQMVVDFWKKQVKPDYRVDFSSMGEEEGEPAPGGKGDISGADAMYREVIEFCREKGYVSISLLQRRFNIGFNKAARYMDQLDKDGLVGPSPGAGKPRPVLIR